MVDNSPKDIYWKLFNQLKSEIAALDPVSFAENHLTIDGKPFRMSGTGWKFMADLYREVAVQVDNKHAKPIVILKGRQIGATVLAAVLSLYFTASGLFGTGPDRPPIRILHVFPTLGLMSKYAKDKLGPIVANSQNSYITKRFLTGDPTAIKVAGTQESIAEKTFMGYNKLRVDGTGHDGDRIRGLSMDAIFFDECLVYDTQIETNSGKMAIGELVEKFIAKDQLPLVKTFNHIAGEFEYKPVINAWNKGIRDIVQINLGKNKIRCTANHRFLTERGWVYAGQLQIGDLVLGSPSTKQYLRALNDDQVQIALGSFLGDGNLQQYAPGRYRLRVIHGNRQELYCKWKASIFASDVTRIAQNGISGGPAWRFVSKGFALPYKLPSGAKKSVPQWVLDRLDARGLAIWFMDDGSVNGTRKSFAQIHTSSFDEDSQKRMVAKLKTMGIDCQYHMYDNYYRILIPKSGCEQLFKLIAKYMHPDIYYKIKFPELTERYAWNNKFKNHSYYIVDNLTVLTTKQCVYDIEIADNHNFIVTSGKTSKNLGGVILSNCQDVSRDAIETAGPILTSAQYGAPTKGIQLYFGTPKGTGSHFYNIWNKSDQRFYQFRCIGCQEFFFFYTMGSESWREIWISGHDIKCPQCGCIQKKSEAIEGGRWMSTRPGDYQYIGYHVSVLLHPWFTKEAILDLDPSINRERSEKAWKNETLGEFYSGGGITLSLDELRRYCEDPTRGLSKAVVADTDKTMVMGIDWGGKDLNEGDDEDKPKTGQSYTAIVIMSVDNKGIFTIENAYRLKNNTFQYKVDTIKELYRMFKIQVGAADWFYGQDVVTHLQGAEGFGARFLGCINSGTLSSILSYKPKELRVILNKDAMIEDMFSMVRNGKLKFPVRGESYDRIEWLMQHFTSMEVKKVSKSENIYNKYIKGAIQNDGLMAAIYALIAYRFIATNGFKAAESNKKTPLAPVPILTYLPRLR